MMDQKSVASLFRKAERLEKKERLSEARDLYLAIIQVYPNNKKIKKRILTLDKSLLKQNHDAVPGISLSDAVEAFNKGMHEDALSLAAKLIERNRDIAQAHNLIGVIHHSRGAFTQAAESFLAAINEDKILADAHNNYGLILYAQGTPEMATDCFLRAIKINPSYVEAYNNLGNAYFTLKDWINATASYRKALKFNPDHLDAMTNLAAALKSQRSAQDLTEAAGLCERALRISPKNRNALLNYGAILKDLKRFDESRKAYELAISLYPNDAVILNNIGNLHLDTGNVSPAIISLAKAVKINGDYSEAQNNLGAALLKVGSLNDAFGHLSIAVKQQPQIALFRKNLGDCLRELGNIDAAEREYLHALEMDEGHIDTWSALSILYAQVDRLEDAKLILESGLKKHPNSSELLINLGNVCHKSKTFHEAIAIYRKVVDAGVRWPVVYNNLGLSLMEIKDFDSAAEAFISAIKEDKDYRLTYVNLASLSMKKFNTVKAIEYYKIAYQPPVLGVATPTAFSNFLFCLNYSNMIGRDEILYWHKLYQNFFNLQSRCSLVFNNRKISKKAKIRLGFVSADLCNHSVAFFFLPALKNLDTEKFDIILYNVGKSHDHVTDCFKVLATIWRDVSQLSDTNLREMIVSDGVDILFDLSGHTGGNRLPVFANRSAPIQVTWIGYPNTTGLDEMDYRIVDYFTDPQDLSEQYHSEKLYRIEPCFLVYEPPIGANLLNVCDLPALRNDYISFGSFNNFAKINEAVLECWLNILKECNGSMLYLKSSMSGDADDFRRRFSRLFCEYDREFERIVVLDRVDAQHEHLLLYNKIDIALDTFPYTGVTTTCEALYMGVPVVSLVGEAHGSRVAGSILSSVGMDFCLSHDVDSYVKNAVELSADHVFLAELRQSLRSRMEESDLLNGRKFGIKFEKFMEEVVRQHNLTVPR